MFPQLTKISIGVALLLGASIATAGQPVSTTDKTSQAVASASALQTQKSEEKSHQFIVKFRDGATPGQMDDVVKKFKAKKLKSFYRPARASELADRMKGWRVVSFEADQDLKATFEQLQKDPSVEYVAPNKRVKVMRTPNDLKSQLWGLNNTGQTGGKADADIDAPEAWDTITASNVPVAVIDSGVDYTHPDLAANMWKNPGEIPGNGIDDDGNGLVDDVYGYDFFNDDANPMDDNGHGTHVAGTIGAVGNNGTGVTGVAWGAKIMALKFIGADGYGYISDAIDAILYATDMGAKVANNSWGGLDNPGPGVQFSRPLQDAIQAAADSGMLFVAAAGNDGTYLDSNYNLMVPAGLPLRNIISVAATDHNDALASFSNYGAVEVDIAAPGVDIYSTLPGNSYGTYSGTSMAAPHVTGAAALLYAQNPTATPEEIKAILMNKVDAIPGLANRVASGGRLNLNKAVRFRGGADCQAFNTTAASHITAGRAFACGTSNLYACALGSNQQIGLRSSYTLVSVVKAKDNYYTLGTCKPGNMPPKISLTGDVEKNILVGTAYTVPTTMTASDREDGNLTSKIRVTGNVNTAVAGDYTIQYDVSDSAGNPAVPEKRLIHVLDYDGAPWVELFGAYSSPMFFIPNIVQINTPFVEQGYYAWDELDGDLTSKVTTQSNVDTSKIGWYKVSYDVVDSRGQHNDSKDFVYRDVFVVDPVLPHIFLQYPEIKFARGFDHNWYFMKLAMDLKDGRLNIVENGSYDINTIGTYYLNYSATDSDGNTATATHTIRVLADVTSPTATLNGSATVTVERSSTWDDPWVKAVDDLDIDPIVDRVGTVDTNVVGTYQLQYKVSDHSGNVGPTLTRTVKVVESCTNYSATVSQHITANRAHICNTSYGCANGSNDNLGSRYGTIPVAIREQPSGSGFFYKGVCPAN